MSGHDWLSDVDPHAWTPDMQARLMDALTAARCRDCDGTGEVETGRYIPADMFGPREPILTRCATCDGTGYPEETP